jgi:cellulose synthase/poly-beta-1,6-N-acetylglucosamine synthase-like glycosyltransferase/peptidoglycan/xylan/chitin deacetylase (PgdA/CDA1 family)/spore germination protein YaaH
MSKNREHPVFFDPDNKRWPRLRRGVYLTGLALTVLFGILILSILISPALLPLKFDEPTRASEQRANERVPLPDPPQLLTKAERRFRAEKAKLEAESLKRAQAVRVRPNPKPASNLLTVAFFVPWDDASPSSLKTSLANPEIGLDVVIAEWLRLDNDDGRLSDEAYLDVKKEALNFIRTTRPDTRVMALVNNFNSETSEFESARLDAMLESPSARARSIRQLLDTAQTYKLQGISIDFENVLDKSQPFLLQFLAELRDVLQPAGLEISINLPANNDSFDYAKISSLVDYVILMVYDQHYTSKESGPVAAIDWFTDVLTMRQKDVPAAKMIVAIGNYSYDWPAGGEAKTLTFQEALTRARENEVDRVELDAASLTPTFRYVNYDNPKQPESHTVWMLDGVSAFNQVAVARSFAARGVALWRMGSEDPSLWSFYGRNLPLDANAAAQLSNMIYGYDLDYENQGEILRVEAEPKDGSRTIQFDAARGFIISESMTRANLPSPYVIERYGHAARKLALTFDDGPDPEWTPKILDALKQAKAPATFFVIGLNAEQYPDLIRREVAEGHELGNHTFTHPNIANISNTQFGFELSATRVLMESLVGRRTYLFRPPYAEDVEPTTPDEVRPLEAVSDRGYLTVGMLVDPKDWIAPKTEEEKKVEEIVKAVVDGAGDPNNPNGNVILLHDSGGDRSYTVAALPMIISEMRKRGFEFVAVSDLLGKSRDEVMPLIDTRSQWQAMADRAAFDVINFGIRLIRWLFLIGIILGIARLLFIGTLAVIEHRRERHAVYDLDYSPTVAVIVPAYNEEKVIVQTITSLLASDHPPNFEIVVIDDGSNDATCNRVKDAFSDEPRVRLFGKANGGKPAALNFGVTHTNADIVIALDADTIFARDTISKLVRHFADPQIGAVAGNAKVGNRLNLLTRWQALEYITSQNLDRRAFNLLNCITVVPGAVGAWRRELVIEAGGFTDETLAEDADLTMAIRKMGYSIVYEDEAMALTEAPDTVRGFVKQRYRWMYGTLQAAWKHKGALFRPRYGSLGFVALPNIFIFQVLFPLISPAMDLLMLVTMVMTAVDRWQHPDEFSADSLKRALFYYAIFMAMEFLSATLAFLLEDKENRRLLVWLFLQRFFYRQLMYYVAIKSTFASLRGIAVGWNKLERKATVKA